MREAAKTAGKRFAVIADEAHSSQTGQAAAKLKQVLTADEAKELDDGGEVSMDDVLAAEMAARASDKGITYVAFTATPKAKTLELFGRRPKPDEPAREPDNLPEPFHVYSMRQAIEEGFILDVLRNYTPYKLAFRLANDGKEMDETEVERDAAMKGIMRWVRLHPYNIASEGRDRRRALPRERRAAARRQGQGDGGAGEPRGGGALEARHRQVHPRRPATRSARWWPSPAR